MCSLDFHGGHLRVKPARLMRLPPVLVKEQKHLFGKLNKYFCNYYKK